MAFFTELFSRPRPQETARYRADVEHEIVNDGSVPARAFMVVVYD